jgi:peptidoglycan/LPS O-acetylase OafA/YrhL
MTITAVASEVPVAATGGTTVARNGGIDALRACLTLLVVLHHTAITYGGSGGWFYRELLPSDTHTSRLLSLFLAINQSYFMGLFFLIAGYFTPAAVERHGVPAFVRDRLIRLGVPLLVFAVLIGPATVALVQAVTRHRDFGAVLLRQWQTGSFEPGPPWFCEALLIFAAAYLLVRFIFGRPGRFAFPSNRMLLLAAVATGIAAFLLRLKWPVGVNVLALQLGYFASYIVLFVAGCLGAEARWLEHLPAAQVKLWRRVAWVTLPVLPLGVLATLVVPALQGHTEGGWTMPAVLYAFWEPFVAWGIILALLALFERRFEALTPFWANLSRRAYLIFIIHPPVLVAIALAWREVALTPLLKFAITGLLACVACYLIAGVLLRVPVVRRVV